MATAPAVARQAQQATPVVEDDRDLLRHEIFCQPTADSATGALRDEIRIESFPHYRDNPESNRSEISHKITRCMECGASFAREV